MTHKTRVSHQPVVTSVSVRMLFFLPSYSSFRYCPKLSTNGQTVGWPILRNFFFILVVFAALFPVHQRLPFNAFSRKELAGLCWVCQAVSGAAWCPVTHSASNAVPRKCHNTRKIHIQRAEMTGEEHT